MSVRLLVDDENDVLYARVEEASIRSSTEAPSDAELIFNLDTSGAVIGVQLIGAHQLGGRAWMHHPDRSLLPPGLLVAIDEWMIKQP